MAFSRRSIDWQECDNDGDDDNVDGDGDGDGDDGHEDASTSESFRESSVGSPGGASQEVCVACEADDAAVQMGALEGCQVSKRAR